MSSLVGTKWVFNKVINTFGGSSHQYNISFTSNSQTFTSIRDNLQSIDTWAMGYNNTKVYDTGSWTNQAYRLITITGGTDATTESSFYTWLTNNATQVPVVDLSGTEWVLKNSLIYINDCEFTNILFTNNGYNFNRIHIHRESVFYTYTIIQIGSVEPINGNYSHYVTSLFNPSPSPSPSPVPVPQQPYWSWCNFNGNAVSYSNCPWLEFTFTGGTDATNPDLIVWLTNNATYQEPISGHTLTIDGTDYTIDDNTNLLVNSTGLYNSTTSTQVWTYSGDTKFLGFATSSGGAIVYDINDTITLTSNLTLYSVQQERMPLYINGVQTDKYHGKIVNKIGDYFVARYEYSITTSVTNGTYSGATSILVNGTATVTITADSGYELPSSVTVTGASYSYNNGVISLSNPTGDVTISAVCEAVVSGYSVTFIASSYWYNESVGSIKIYDGQDNTGTLLLNQTPANKSAFPMILQVSSGYCYVELSSSGYIMGGINSDYIKEGDSLYNTMFYIYKNGLIDISVYDWDD